MGIRQSPENAIQWDVEAADGTAHELQVILTDVLGSGEGVSISREGRLGVSARVYLTGYQKAAVRRLLSYGGHEAIFTRVKSN